MITGKLNEEFLNYILCLKIFTYAYNMFDHTAPTSPQLLPDSFNSTPAQLYVLKNYHLPSPICAAHKLIGMWSFTGTGQLSRDCSLQENWVFLHRQLSAM